MAGEIYRRSYSSAFGRVGVGEDFITFTLQSKEFVHLVDRISRKFLGGAFQNALGKANEGAAIAMQQSIADALDESIKRHRTRDRKRRTGERTKMAILDSKNREVFANTFRVGIPAWYDRSPAALYWRLVEEEGMEPFETLGLFVDPGVVGPRPAPEGQYALIQSKAKTWKRGRAPVVIKTKKFDAYHYHRVGILNGISTLKMGHRYLTALTPLGLAMQVRMDTFGEYPSLNFGYSDK